MMGDLVTMAPTETFPRSFRLTREEVAALEAVASARFNGRKTDAIRAAIELAAMVYALPAARAEATPRDALAAYVREGGAMP